MNKKAVKYLKAKLNNQIFNNDNALLDNKEKILNGEYKINRDCIFVSHLGLGDNITMCGAVRYLSYFYKTIYVIAKNTNIKNVQMIYEDNENIKCIEIDPKTEVDSIRNVLSSYLNMDVFISGGCHKPYFSNNITNEYLINHKYKNDISFRYQFIVDFFNDIFFDFRIYSSFFKISSTEITQNYYNKLNNYKIIFLHTKSSNCEININMSNYITNNDYIIICANKNYYDASHNYYSLAEEYVNLPVCHYIDIIKNANIIKVIDSSFACIILPLQQDNKLLAETIEFINR